MRFDGPTLAHAWLAVMAATGDDKNRATTYKTIAPEEHLHGVRLVASDSRLMLTAYVPDLETYYDSPPEPAELPEHVHVVSDRDGRARGLLGHVCALAHKLDPEDYTPGDLEVRLDFRQAPTNVQGSGPVQPTLDGMDPTYATLTVPGRERLNIEIIAESFPDWRRVADHRAKRTLGVLLPPEQLEKLGRIRKHARGPLQITMGLATAHVEYPESDPNIAGVLVLADPEDPQVYQGDDPTGEQPAPADPLQTTIDDHIELVHWIGEGDNTLHGNGAGSRDMEQTSGDEDEVTCKLCHDLLRRKRVEDDAEWNPTAAWPRREAPDVMLRDAAELTVRTQLGSAAQLQRTLRIGQARAARLMDALEEQGVVGPADSDSGKSRPVLLKSDQVDQALQAIDAITSGDQQ